MPRRSGDNSRSCSECLRDEANEIAEAMIELAKLIAQAARTPEAD